LKYSEGHFGFSAQREILITELGAALDGNYPNKELWNRFGDLVGWQVNEKWLSREALTYDLSAQRGHLPSISGGWYPKGGWISIYGRPGLLVRVESCEGL
jgi:hypothetical protein